MKRFKKKVEYFDIHIILVTTLLPIFASFDTTRSNIIPILFLLSTVLFLFVVVLDFDNLLMFLKKNWYVLMLSLLVLLTQLFLSNEISQMKLPLLIIFSIFYNLYLFHYLIINKKMNLFIAKTTRVLMTMGVMFTGVILLNIVLKSGIIQDSNGYYYQISEIFPNIFLRQKVMGLGLAKRYSSVFSNPNGLGMYYIIAIPLTLYYFKDGKSLLFKDKIIIVLLILGLLLSQSRASIMTVSFFIAIQYFSNLYTMLRSKKTLSLLLIILFVLILTVFMFFNRGPISLNGRLGSWEVAYNAFLRSPIIGNGIMNFNHEIISYGYLHAHNSYLQILASGGLALFVLYLIFVIYYFRECISVIRGVHKEEGKFAVSFLASLLLFQLFELNILIYHYHLSFVILIYFMLLNMNESNY